MIQEYIDAWNERKDIFEHWLRHCVNANRMSYEDIVRGIVTEVINPTVEDTYSNVLDIGKMRVIDDGDWQGTTIYIIPKDTYQPNIDEYVITHNYYSSCSGCDTLLACQGWSDEEVSDETIKGIMTIALHLIENMKLLGE